MSSIKVDPAKLEELSAMLKKLSGTIGDREQYLFQDITQLTRQLRGDYPEREVQRALDKVDADLQAIRKMASSVTSRLTKKSDVLIQAASIYRRDEEKAKKTMKQKYIPPAPSSYYIKGGGLSGEGLKDYLDDPLFQDPVVQKLHEVALHGTEEEQTEAKKKLDEIFKARNTIARAQVAHAVYKSFGNIPLMNNAHKEAFNQREILKRYGISEDFYKEGVDLTALYKGSKLEACSYDPSFQIMKDDKFIPVLLPQDNQYHYLLGLIMEGGSKGAWAQKQLDEIHEQLKEIGRAQVAWWEYKAKNMKNEMDGAHEYAEKLRKILKNKYSLSSETVDGVDFKNLWVGVGAAGKALNVEETNGYNTSGDPKLLSKSKYNHEKESVSKINQIDELTFGKTLKSFAKIYEKNKDVYERISKKTGIPPQLVAAIHYRESTCNFNTYLHNGQVLGKVTTKEPKGILFDNFEDAAVHALLQKKDLRDAYRLNSQSNDLIAMLSFAEAYNGWGYHSKGRISPYVYSGTNIYKKGKYVKDGVYDPEFVDEQPGIYILLNAIEPHNESTVPNVENFPKDKGKNQGYSHTFEANVKTAQKALEEKLRLSKGATTIPNLQNFPLYVQGDSRYGKEKLGNGKTMAQIGCTTTALAAVNAWSTFGNWKGGEEPHPGKYNDTVKYDSSGNLYWNSAEISRPKEINFKYGESGFEDLVKKSVDKGHPVLFAVNGGEHWMVAVGYDNEGTVIVYNPADGSLSTTREINEKRSARGKKLYKTINRYGEL
ncbi:C39 family peptidase [Paenibacillus sp. FSL R5-0407]|uniref:C39 family peptidase n=1 Tax=Paenibacillus sp. FSL R5-0407 TaxID=2975320 RepID=UPI0030F90899